ncbi:hypothetical protein R1sor_025208 [Riccia sorocarpa]|uniref:CCHC-type domain-containing protein n=1 Tax=Riccia sorocarpa TaxID=122646 RepID=A0ABD3GB08_9MARC
MQLADEKEIASNSQEIEEELYWVDEYGHPICSIADYTSWGGVIPLCQYCGLLGHIAHCCPQLFVPETEVERAELSNTQSSEEEDSSWSSEEEIDYKRRRSPNCSSWSDFEEEERCNLQVEESESDVPVPTIEELQACEDNEADEEEDGVVENIIQLHQLLPVEPKEVVAEELSLEVEYSESISEPSDTSTCSTIVAEQSFVQPLAIPADKEAEEESSTSEMVNELLLEEMVKSSSHVGADHTSTIPKLEQFIEDISVLTDAEEKPVEEKLEAEVSFAPRWNKLEGQIDTFVFKGLTWNLWRAMRAHGRKVFGLLQFMEENRLFFRNAIGTCVHLTLEEEFLDSRLRNRPLRLGYRGGHAENREGGVAEVPILNLSSKKYGSVEEGEVTLQQTATAKPSTREEWRIEIAAVCSGEPDTLVGSTIIAKGYCSTC